MLCSVCGCYVADCVRPFQTKTTRHGKTWPDTHRFPPGRLARRRRELHRWSTCYCSGTPLQLDIFTLRLRVCTCLYVCGLRMCSDSTYTFYLTVSDKLAEGRAGKDGAALLLLSSALAATQVEAWLVGHAAAACSCGTCLRSLICSAQSPSRMLCGRLCPISAEKSGME